MCQHLVAGEQFGIIGQHDCSLEVSLLVEPTLSVITVPAFQVRLRWPFAAGLQSLNQFGGRPTVRLIRIEGLIREVDIEVADQPEPSSENRVYST